MEKVVLSVDGSAESRAATRWCVHHLRAPATVITVCGITELGEFVLSIPPFGPPLSAAQIEESLKGRWADPLRRAGLRPDPRFIHDRQGAAVCQVAELEHPDAVI